MASPLPAARIAAIESVSANSRGRRDVEQQAASARSDELKGYALGFIGVMTRGMHHQEHHLMIARGQHPHG